MTAAEPSTAPQYARCIGVSVEPGETTLHRIPYGASSNPRHFMNSEVAAAVLYLASPEAAFAVGTDLVLDGGATA